MRSNVAVVASDTRQQMIATAVRMFQREGYTGTSWRGLVNEAGTPWGSVQHHFPGGKEELAVSAIQVAGNLVSRTMAKAFRDHESAADAVSWWFGKAAEILETSGYRSGCPLATVALEKSHDSPALTAAIEQAFRSWLAELAESLQQRGAPADLAGELALQVLIGLEGALVLARVLGSTAPISASAAALAPALSRATR
jgi:TetR/AcrR family transcriptional repressor of lmrAB and yxaGH operons